MRPHKITAWGNVAAGIFSVFVLFLTSPFTSYCEYFPSRQCCKLTDTKNHLLQFLLQLPFCLIPGRSGHPLWGIWGTASCSPPPPPQRGRLPWVTSSNYPIGRNRNKLLFLCPRLCGSEATIPNNQIKEAETASPVKDNASWSLVKTSRPSFS